MTLKKRPDGRYTSKVYLGRDENGKAKYKFVYGQTAKEVEKKIRELKNQLDKGLDPTQEYTFSEAARAFLSARKSSLTADSAKTLEFRLAPFVEALGNKKIKEIRKAQIQPILNDLALCNPSTGKPSAQRTVSRYLTACSAVFENAIENRLIDYNPCKYLTIPKGLEKHERRALTDEERQRIEETPHRGQLPAMLMIYSGLRKGESTALKWSDIDLDAGTITVNKSFDFKSGRIKTPKTAAGVRVVSIPNKLVGYLKKQERNGPYVLHNKNGQMLTLSSWQKMWESFLLALDLKYGEGEKEALYSPHGHELTIKPFTIHECRHTFCTLMYLAGVDILTAQQQMGHADVKTTLGIYSHLDGIYKKKNINKLDTFLD